MSKRSVRRAKARTSRAMQRQGPIERGPPVALRQRQVMQSSNNYTQFTREMQPFLQVDTMNAAPCFRIQLQPALKQTDYNRFPSDTASTTRVGTPFPVMADIANRYSEYRIKGLKLHFVGAQGTDTPGAIRVAFTQKANVGNLNTFLPAYQEAGEWAKVWTFKPWETECMSIPHSTKWYKTRQFMVEDSALPLYDAGVLLIKAQGLPVTFGSDEFVGEFFWSYHVEFRGFLSEDQNVIIRNDTVSMLSPTFSAYTTIAGGALPIGNLPSTVEAENLQNPVQVEAVNVSSSTGNTEGIMFTQPAVVCAVYCATVVSNGGNNTPIWSMLLNGSTVASKLLRTIGGDGLQQILQCIISVEAGDILTITTDAISSVVTAAETLLTLI